MDTVKKVIQWFLIIVALVIAILIFIPQVHYGKSVVISAGLGDKISILGVDSVKVKGDSPDYFRIVSGDSQIYGLPLTDTRFENEGELSTKNSLRITHGRADYTFSADSYMKVTKYQSIGLSIILTILVIILTLIISFFVWTC